MLTLSLDDNFRGASYRGDLQPTPRPLTAGEVIRVREGESFVVEVAPQRREGVVRVAIGDRQPTSLPFSAKVRASGSLSLKKLSPGPHSLLIAAENGVDDTRNTIFEFQLFIVRGPRAV